MIERGKTVLLALLVVVSLVQSYLLAYSMPGMEVNVRTEQDYVTTEPLGPEEQMNKLLLPEELVLHLGSEF